MTRPRGSAPGPVAVTTLRWRLAGELRVTVVAKVALSYEDNGDMTIAPPPPIVGHDLAPLLAKPEVLVSGTAHGPRAAVEAGFRVERRGQKLLEKLANTPSGGPIAGLMGTTAAWPIAEAVLRDGVAALPRGSHEAFQRTADQRLDALQLDEEIVLLHLHERRRRQRLRLPKLTLVASLTTGDARRAVSLRPDTLFIDAHAQACHVVWRAVLAVDDEAAASHLTVTAAHQRRSQELAPRATRTALPHAPQRAGPTLPFSDEQLTQAPPLATELHTAPATGTVQLDGAVREKLRAALATPFEAEPPDAAQPVAIGTKDATDATSTQSLSHEALRQAAKNEALPFGTPPTPTRPQRDRVIPGAPWSQSGTEEVPMPSSVASHTLNLCPPPPPEKLAPEPEPAKEAPKPLERPIEPHVSGPEMGPVNTDAIKPKRRARKNLNAQIYGRTRKKR